MELEPEAESDGRTSRAGSVEEAKPKIQWRSLFRFTSKSHGLILFLALLAAACSGALVPAQAYLLGKIFGAFTTYGSGNSSPHVFLVDAAQFAVDIVILGALNLVLSAVFFFLWILFGELQAKSAHHRLFSSMLDKEIAWFDTRKSGITALTPRIQSLVRELQLATSQPLGLCFQYSSTILSALALALYSAWDLTLVALASAPIGAIILGLLSSRLHPHITRQSEHLETSTKHAAAAINAIETVKCANAQAFELRQYVDTIKLAASAYISQAQINAVQFGFIRFLTLAIFVQGFWYGSHLVENGTRTFSQILTAFYACLIATQTIDGLLQQLLVIEKGRSAGEMLYSIASDAERTDKGRDSGINPTHCCGDIQFADVSFAYPSRPDTTVLQNVNMFFAAGETTFVVGKSGSGKSTLSSLLLGFYPPDGKIVIDGNDISTLRRDWLRNNITVMQQQSILFNESILRNIAFGLRDFEDTRPEDLTKGIRYADILKCIRYAALEETVVGLPEGLDTRVGAGGRFMSGGQRQRISFARALLRDTPILVFDEATSALDRASADIILQSIRTWRKNKTTIIITHDLSQVLPDDYVYVLDHGKVAQEGYRSSLGSTESDLFNDLLGLKAIEEAVEVKLPSPDSTLISTDSIVLDDSKVTVPRIVVDIAEVENDDTEDKSPAIDLCDLPSQCEKLSWHNVNSISEELPGPRNSYESSAGESFVSALSGLGQFSSTYRETGPSDAQVDEKSTSIATEKEEIIDSKALPGSKQQKSMLSAWQILATVWPHLVWNQRILLLFGFAAAIGHAVSTPVFSWAFSKLLATFLNTGAYEFHESLRWSLAVLAVAIVDGFLTYLMRYLLETQGQGWVDALRAKAYQRILDQPRVWFDEVDHATHNLVSCLDRNAEEMRNLLGRFLGPIIMTVTMTSIAVTWCLILCWKLTLVTLACGPVVYAMSQLFNSVNGSWEKKCNEATLPVAESFMETFGNIRTVRALTLENYFHRKHSKLTRQALAVGIKRAIYSGFFFGISDTFVLSIMALVFWYSSRLVAYDGTSVQTILTVISLLLFTLTSAASMIRFIPQLNSSRDTGTQLLNLVNLPYRKSHEYAGTHKPKALDGDIEVNHLTFTYPSRPQKPAIEDLSLSIKTGTSTAIYGASGSGKSTLIALILGLYAPNPKEAITLSSRPICEFHVPTLRAIVALSPQHPPIFPTSIKANIAYSLSAEPGLATMENIIRAAKLAGIHEFIDSLPDGYETLVGEGASLLSGGQTARIGLARALCRRPNILILDEPTAGLDGVGKGDLIEVIQNLVSTDLTVIVVTHDEVLRNGCEFVLELK